MANKEYFRWKSLDEYFRKMFVLVRIILPRQGKFIYIAHFIHNVNSKCLGSKIIIKKIYNHNNKNKEFKNFKNDLKIYLKWTKTVKNRKWLYIKYSA